MLSQRRTLNSGRSFSPFSEDGVISGNTVDCGKKL
jgi:hypothetical protein